MRPALVRTALLAAVAALVPAATAAAQARLTGVTVYSATSTGAQTGVERWDTKPSGLADVYLSTTATPSQNSDYLNPGATLNHGLNTSGTYTFYLRTIQAFNTPYYGINLLFNDATTADISAFTQFNCVGCSGSAAAVGTLTPDGLARGGEVVVGGQRITFRSFNFVGGAADRVGTYAPTPDGNNDYAGVLQFDVNPAASPTVAPEPASVAMMGLGLAGVGAVVRRRRGGLSPAVG